jgi:hypothetical protein
MSRFSTAELRTADVVAVVVRTDELGAIWASVEREITAVEAEAMNAGAIASPNLYLSLSEDARRILVRVFEKPVARGSSSDP